MSGRKAKRKAGRPAIWPKPETHEKIVSIRDDYRLGTIVNAVDVVVDHYLATAQRPNSVLVKS